MKQYLELVKHIMDNGDYTGNRTGVCTKSVFGYQMRFNLAEGFPLVTTKKVPFNLVVAELLWFLSGSTNINDLRALNNNGSTETIWDEWAIENGSVGPIYGEQWRYWADYDGTTIDQINTVVETIKRNPNSRRLIVSAWNVADLPDESMSPQDNVELARMSLAPCHCLFQFYVANGKLSCQLYQRSADVMLGVPFNIASYAILVHLVAQQCNLGVGDFIWTGGNVHIYSTHFDGAREQVGRIPYSLPGLLIKRKPKSIFEYQPDDFCLINYDAHPHIAFEIAI